MDDTTSTTEVKSGTRIEQFKSRPVTDNGRRSESPVAAEPAGPPKTIFREYFESAVVTVIMALFGMTLIVQAVKVSNGSMQYTITIGDLYVVNYFRFIPL